MKLNKILEMKPYPCLDILSAVENNSGHTLKIEFIEKNKTILESGVSKFEINEGVSKLFDVNFNITLAHNEFVSLCYKMNLHGHELDHESISSFFYFKGVYVQVFNSDGVTVKSFHAFISCVNVSSFKSENNNFFDIHFQAQPLPWFMQKANCYRAYINKTVKEIIEDIFKDFCLDSSLSFEYKPDFMVNPKKKTNRINCVQNGESHWDFILRLLDEEDWNYSFVHKDKSCDFIIFDDIQIPTMLIPDGTAKSINLEILDDDKLMSDFLAEKSKLKMDYLTNLSFSNYGSSSPVQVLDSDSRVHGKSLKSAETKPESVANRPNPVKLKWTYGFEGSKKYHKDEDVSLHPREKAKNLENKRSSDRYLAQANTNSFDMYLGSVVSAKYSLFSKKIISSSLKRLEKYRVQEMVFHFESMFLNGKMNCEYSSKIILHPSDTKYAVEQPYIRNYIDGTIHGIIKADDKKIDLDDKKHFIKVSLPWQYEGLPIKSDYVLARYMSPWASENYGFFVTPRSGDEVVIAFEDGDPDLPVVLGCLYNSKRKYPVDAKAKKHVLAIYDQPSANKKNNFLIMDHKAASFHAAAAEHMKISSFGDHLSQSKSTMTMKTAKNMLSTSKEQMEFKAEKNMLHESKEEMEFKTEKNMLSTSKEQMEFATEKSMLHESKEEMEFVTKKNMFFESKEQYEVKSEDTFFVRSKNDSTLKSDKNIVLNSKQKIILESNNELEIQVGSSKIIVDKSGNVEIKCTHLKIESGGIKLELA